MPKVKGHNIKGKKDRIKEGSRVQLKGVVNSDGHVSAKSQAKKAWWEVTWTSHPQSMTSTLQSSKSLVLWKFDLQQIESDSEDDAKEDDVAESDDDETKPEEVIDYASQKRKFESFAKTLEGTEVTVSFVLVSCISSFCYFLFVSSGSRQDDGINYLDIQAAWVY